MIRFNSTCNCDKDRYDETPYMTKNTVTVIFIYFYWVGYSRKVKEHMLNKYVLISRLLNWTKLSVQNLNVAEYETILEHPVCMNKFI